MKQVAIIWIIFGFLFLGLSIFHFYQSSQKIKTIDVTERPENKNFTATFKFKGMDIDQPVKDLGVNLNQYIENINNSNTWMNVIAGVGYLLASSTAFFSFYLSITEK